MIKFKTIDGREVEIVHSIILQIHQLSDGKNLVEKFIVTTALSTMYWMVDRPTKEKIVKAVTSYHKNSHNNDRFWERENEDEDDTDG